MFFPREKEMIHKYRVSKFKWDVVSEADFSEKFSDRYALRLIDERDFVPKTYYFLFTGAQLYDGGLVFIKHMVEMLMLDAFRGY